MGRMKAFGFDCWEAWQSGDHADLEKVASHWNVPLSYVLETVRHMEESHRLNARMWGDIEE